MIVARDEGETNYLAGYRSRFDHLLMTSHSGPLTLLEGTLDDNDLRLAAGIAARFGQGRDADQVSFQSVTTEGRTTRLVVAPMKPVQIPRTWYL
jgi:hypothetical protein